MAESITTRTFTGRKVLYTDEVEITAENIGDVLEAAMNDHESNASDIDYLYDYYKGKQVVLNRTKDYNDNILNKVVVNKANQIVSFVTGYFLSSPIQYISLDQEAPPEGLKKLNRWCEMESKDCLDLAVFEWEVISGAGYKMVLPKPERLDDTESPFEAYSLDPRNTFIVYSSRLGHKPMLACTYTTLDDDSHLYYVYTATDFYVLDDDYNDASDDVTKSGSHALPEIPIYEYPLNSARMGYIELVIALLDAINTVQSNRVDGVEQFIQAILCLEGMIPEIKSGESQADAEAEFMSSLKEIGGLFIPKDGKAYYLTQELNQDQVQTLVDNLSEQILEICGIPDRSDGSTNGDTGSAIVLRNGWSDAETRAKNAESFFRRSERKFLNALINICNTIGGTNLTNDQVDIRFPRRNYTNDSAKVSNLVTMLSSDQIHPLDAFEHSDMFPDPDAAYARGQAWKEQQEQKTVNELATFDTEEEVVEDEDNQTSSTVG